MPKPIKEFLDKLRAEAQIGFSFGNLNFISASKEDIEGLASLIRKTTAENLYRKIVSFDEIDWSTISPETFSKMTPVFEAIESTPIITGLSLHNSKLDKANPLILERLFQCILRSAIHTLVISSNNMSASPNTIQFMLKLGGTKLQVLNCNSTGLGNCDYNTIKKIFEALAANKNLLKLKLSNFDFKQDKENGKLLSILLKGNIVDLKLSHGQFAEPLCLKRWKSYLEIFSSAVKLKKLDLSSCDLILLELEGMNDESQSDVFVKELGNLLKTTSTESIDLSYNSFTKETSQSLLEFALQNKNLNLDFEGNNLNSKEMEELKSKQKVAQKNNTHNLPLAIPKELTLTPLFDNLAQASDVIAASLKADDKCRLAAKK